LGKLNQPCNVQHAHALTDDKTGFMECTTVVAKNGKTLSYFLWSFPVKHNEANFILFSNFADIQQDLVNLSRSWRTWRQDEIIPSP